MGSRSSGVDHPHFFVVHNHEAVALDDTGTNITTMCSVLVLEKTDAFLHLGHICAFCSPLGSTCVS